MNILELAGSQEFRNLLLLIITVFVILISLKLIQFLDKLTKKAEFEKDIALRENLSDMAKNLIVTAEKRFVEDPSKREGWVIDMLKFHFSDDIKENPELTDDELLALVQKNYEELKTNIPETRWTAIEKKKSRK